MSVTWTLSFKGKWKKEHTKTCVLHEDDNFSQKKAAHLQQMSPISTASEYVVLKPCTKDVPVRATTSTSSKYERRITNAKTRNSSQESNCLELAARTKTSSPLGSSFEPNPQQQQQRVHCRSLAGYIGLYKRNGRVDSTLTQGLHILQRNKNTRTLFFVSCKYSSTKQKKHQDWNHEEYLYQ